MPIEGFFYCVAAPLSLSLFPSFPGLSGNVCAFHPEKWIFLFGKKSEKSAYSLHAARGSLLGRVQTKRFQSVRAPAVASSTIERKDVERGRKRIESKTAMVAKGKWKPRICVRGASERVKLEGERGTLSLPESGNLTTTARRGKRERVKRTLIICAFRTSGEQKAPRIL